MPAGAGAIRAGRAFVEITGDDAKLQRALKRAQTRLKTFGASVQAAGQSLVKVGAAAAAPFALSVLSFAKFEQAMARVQALTAATAPEFEALSAKAKELGVSTVYSATQAAQAMGYFAQAGFTVEEILGAIGPALNLAAAGQMDFAQAADISVKILRGMGLSVDEASRAMDVMVKAFVTANTDLVQLGDAMKYIGPIARNAGLSFEEITAAVQMLSNAGIQADMAGTTLRGAILSLSAPTPEAAALMEKLGISVSDAAGNFRPLVDIIAQFQRAMTGRGTADQLAILDTLFGKRQAAGFANLIAGGADQLAEFTDRLKGATGTAAKIAAVQLNTLTGDVVILRSALEGLAIAIGQTIGPALRSIAKVATAAVYAVARFVKEHQGLVVAAATAAVTLISAGTGLIAFGLAAKTAAFAIGGLLAGLAVVKTVVGAVVAILGVMASPIGLVVTGLAVLAAELLTTSDTGRRALDVLGRTFTWLKETAGAVIGSIVDALRAGDIAAAANVTMAALQVAWYTGVEAIRSVWARGTRFIQQTWSDMRHALLLGWIETAYKIQEVWANIIAAIKTAISEFVTSWKSAFGLLEVELATAGANVLSVFDSSVDPKAVRAEAQADHAAEAQGWEATNTAARTEAETARTTAIAEAAKQRDAALRELVDQWAKTDREIADQSKGAINAATTKLRDARANLNSAMEAAAKAARLKLPGLPDAAGEGKPKTARDIADALADAMQSATNGVSTFGTFNPFGMRGSLAPGPVSQSDRITHQKLDEIARGIKEEIRAIKSQTAQFM